MPFGGRYGVVQEVGRGFRAEGPVVEDREAVLALNGLLGGEYHGNEVGGNIAVEGDSGPDQRAHGRQARVLEETPPVGVRAAPEQEAVGFVGVPIVALEQSFLRRVSGHGHTPRNGSSAAVPCGDYYVSASCTLRPSGVSRYFWFLAVGDSGRVISINPIDMAG